MKAMKKVVEEAPVKTERSLRRYSHAAGEELSRVLATIAGEADYGLSTASAAARERALNVCLVAAERAIVLARSLRYFALHTRLNPEPADVTKIVLDTFDLFERELETRKIRAVVLASSPVYAEIDPTALVQIVSNLISNSACSMPDGGKLTLGVKVDDGWVQITCTDTGRPYTDREIASLLEATPRLTQSTHSESEELGLSIANALAESHGGRLVIESMPTGGNTFTVRLPHDRSVPTPAPFPHTRRYRRSRVSLAVDFSLDGGTPVRAELTTLSEGGGFIALPDAHSIEPPVVHAPVRLRISYFWNLTIEIPKARIASLRWAGVNRGLGIEFLEVEPRVRKILAAIVKSHAL